MSTRAAVAGFVVALSLGLPVVPTAGAAPTHNCGHLLVDPRGNAYAYFLPTKPYNPEADLLSVDAVTTSANVVFTVAMASVNAQPTTGTSLAIYFSITHQGSVANYLVNIAHEVDGTAYLVQNQDTDEVVHITGSVNPPAGTYVVTVPRNDIDATFRGALLKDLGVWASQDVGTSLAEGGFIEQSTGPEYHYRVGYGYGCGRK